MFNFSHVLITWLVPSHYLVNTYTPMFNLPQRVEDIHAEGRGKGVCFAQVLCGVELDAATGRHKQDSIAEGEG